MSHKKKVEQRDEIESIVIDVGCGVVKAGFSGHDTPDSIFHTVGPHLDIVSEVSGTNDASVPATSKRPVPLRRGIVQDWDSMTAVYNHVFEEELCVDPDQSGMPVLLTDAPKTTKADREKCAEIMFEHFKVPGLYLANQSVLSLFSCGKTRGLVVEMGEGATYSVPVFEGFALPHASVKMPLAGADLTAYLRRLLEERGHTFNNTAAHSAIIRGVKESLCVVSNDYKNDVRNDTDEYAYELPDGQSLTIGNTCRYSVPEAFFNPSILNGNDSSSSNVQNITDCILESIGQCDADLQPDLYSNVILSGGSSLFRGLKTRMQAELEQRVEDAPIEVIMDSQRKYASWIGGSMFASIGTFGKIYVTRQEYEDSGATAVHRKCF